MAGGRRKKTKNKNPISEIETLSIEMEYMSFGQSNLLEYSMEDNYKQLLLPDVKPDIKVRCEQILLAHVKILEKVPNKLYGKPRFKAICRHLDHFFHYKPDPTLNIVKAWTDMKDEFSELIKTDAERYRFCPLLAGSIVFTLGDEEKTKNYICIWSDGEQEIDEEDDDHELEENEEIFPDTVSYSRAITVVFTGTFHAELLRFSHVGDFAPLKVSVERVGDYLDEYCSNLQNLAHDRCFLNLHDVVEYRGAMCLLVDEYDFTLRELMESGEKDFWIELQSVGYDSIWKPSPCFQDIIRVIIDGLIILYEKRISYDLSSSSVVFLADRGRVALRHIFGSYVSKDKLLKVLFKQLKDLVEEVIRACGIVHYVHDITTFFLLLDEIDESLLPQLAKHPVMWQSPSKLHYFSKWQREYTLGNLTLSGNMSRIFQTEHVCPDWGASVDAHPILGKKLRYSKRKVVAYQQKAAPDQEIQPNQLTSLNSLMTFIRNAYEHLTENMLNETDDKGDIVGEDFSGVPILSKQEYDTLLEFLFPKLAWFLVERTLPLDI